MVDKRRNGIFAEQVNSIGKPDKLNEALGFGRLGDVFTLTKPGRLARLVGNLTR